MSAGPKQGFGLLGVGAAACAACCAGPLLAFLGGLGVAGLAGTAVVGMAALLLVIPAIAALVLVRRRRAAGRARPEPTLVEPPRRRVAGHVSLDATGGAR